MVTLLRACVRALNSVHWGFERTRRDTKPCQKSIACCRALEIERTWHWKNDGDKTSWLHQDAAMQARKPASGRVPARLAAAPPALTQHCTSNPNASCQPLACALRGARAGAGALRPHPRAPRRQVRPRTPRPPRRRALPRRPRRPGQRKAPPLPSAPRLVYASCERPEGARPAGGFKRDDGAVWQVAGGAARERHEPRRE